MFGCLSIFLMVVGLVAGVIGFGPACHEFEGIQPICLAPPEQLAAIVVMVIAAGAVAFIFGRAALNKKRDQTRGR